MPLPLTNLSIGNINIEKQLNETGSNTSLATSSIANITQGSLFKPDGVAPHGMAEFRLYDHTGTPKQPSPPTQLTGRGFNGTAILQWASRPALQVDIFRNGVSLATQIAGLNWYIDSTVTIGVTYSYTIRYANGTTFPSSSFTTPFFITP